MFCYWEDLFYGSFFLGLKLRPCHKQFWFYVLPILGFTGIWVLLNNEMNYIRRFQYAVLPIILMSGPPSCPINESIN